jgi:energy-coupling factor transport system permease protein
VRDWLPIVVPLLVSGLERAMGLAEAMVARGYGAVSDEVQPLRRQGLLVVGLLALLGGWLAYLFRPAGRIRAVGVMVVGATLIGIVVWLTGRGVQHTVYRARRWTLGDTLTVAGCAVTLGVGLTQREAIYYSPYPRLELPQFDPFVGLGLLGLLVPAIVTISQDGEEMRSTEDGEQQTL